MADLSSEAMILLFDALSDFFTECLNSVEKANVDSVDVKVEYDHTTPPVIDGNCSQGMLRLMSIPFD